MKFMLVLLLLASLSAYATKPQCDDGPVSEVKQMMEVAKMVSKEKQCPDGTNIKSLCGMVGLHQYDPNPLSKKYKYTYQRKVFEASCVDINKDSEADIAKKVSAMWAKFEKDLHCDNLRFDVANGSLIKFAVSTKLDTFIYDIADWKVDLNKVDESDQRTVLDYIRDEKKRLKGTPLEATLDEYYEVLREAGAKHKSEL